MEPNFALLPSQHDAAECSRAEKGLVFFLLLLHTPLNMYLSNALFPNLLFSLPRLKHADEKYVMEITNGCIGYGEMVYVMN